MKLLAALCSLLAFESADAGVGYSNVITYPYAVTVNVGSPGATIPTDFVGMSWEIKAMASGTFTSGNLAAMLGVMGSKGHLRFGGVTADQTAWLPSTGTVTAVANFVHALGWSSTFSVSCQLNDATTAAAEVAAWDAVLGSTATYEIGTEPNNFGPHGHDGQNNPCYTFGPYTTTWAGLRAAISAAVPAAKFSGPATWVSITQYPDVWTPPFAAAPTLGGVSSGLTAHVYGGNSTGSILVDVLEIYNDPTLANEAAAIPADSSVISSGLKPRLNETGSIINPNTGGSQEGLAISMSLWNLYEMITLAKNGWSGLDVHNGNGVINQHFAYNPLWNINNVYTAVPAFYAMVMFNYLSGGQILPLTTNTLPANVPALAVKTAGGSNDLLLVNMNLSSRVCLRVGSSGSFSTLNALLYTAPAYDSNAVTLGGTQISTSGVFNPTTTSISKVGSTVPVCIPPSSAVLLTLN